jgi:hypothetical protein
MALSSSLLVSAVALFICCFAISHILNIFLKGMMHCSLYIKRRQQGIERYLLLKNEELEELEMFQEPYYLPF